MCATACNQEINSQLKCLLKKALAASLANCISPCCLICDRLLESDMDLPASGFRSPAHLRLSGGWSLCARDISQQVVPALAWLTDTVFKVEEMYTLWVYDVNKVTFLWILYIL